MGKNSFACSECGYIASKWMGKCPDCGSWNSFVEENLTRNPRKKIKKEIIIHNLSEIKKSKNYRYKSCFKEFDHVLGGGAVIGEVVLISGSPGAGKSTLLLQVGIDYANRDTNVLYVSGEESREQIKERSDRIGIKSDNFYIFQEIELELIIEAINQKKPKIVIIDSIQTIFSSEYDSIAGTVTQIRECTMKIVEIAKRNNITFFVVGHITKAGKVAGPKLMEHMVDAVVQLEGEENYLYRILRSYKNRFGPANETGIFNIDENGMSDVKNPAEFFVSQRDEENIGSIIVPVVEGSKIFLLEIQALVNTTVFGMPRRVIQGSDYNRFQIICAILEKKLHQNISNQDVYINLPGGMNIKDTQIDLGIALALISTLNDYKINRRVAAIGELGLRGEIRKATFLKKRVKELEKLGFNEVYIPEANRKELQNEKFKLELLFYKNVEECVKQIF